MKVYMDTAATSRRKPETVYEAMDRFMREVGASPGRSAHGPGIEASRILTAAREKLADLIGAEDPSRVIFTLNCTEALNLAIRGTLKSHDHVIMTSVEHNSVVRPLMAIRDQRQVTLTRIRADSAGLIDPDDLRKAVQPSTALIVMTHASNVTGAIQPVEECARIARQNGIPFLLDAAQTAGCLPIDLSKVPVDMVAISGHKGLLGPQGVGALYIREGLSPRPLKQGGTGSASSAEVQPDIMPDKYESGTPNTPGIAGLSAALDFLAGESVGKVRAHIRDLGQAILEGLGGIEGVVSHGPGDMGLNIGIFSFTIETRDNAAVAEELERRHGIMTRVGLHCAPSAHKTIGTYPEGTIRAGVGYFTTREEIEYFLGSLAEIARGR